MHGISNVMIPKKVTILPVCISKDRFHSDIGLVLYLSGILIKPFLDSIVLAPLL